MIACDLCEKKTAANYTVIFDAIKIGGPPTGSKKEMNKTLHVCDQHMTAVHQVVSLEFFGGDL